PFFASDSANAYFFTSSFFVSVVVVVVAGGDMGVAGGVARLGAVLRRGWAGRCSWVCGASCSWWFRLASPHPWRARARERAPGRGLRRRRLAPAAEGGFDADRGQGPWGAAARWRRNW